MVRHCWPVIAYFNDILAIKLVRNGHAVVIYGIATDHGEAFVHVNFGWCGVSDGWYNYKTLSAQRRLLFIFTLERLAISSTAWFSQ